MVARSVVARVLGVSLRGLPLRTVSLRGVPLLGVLLFGALLLSGASPAAAQAAPQEPEGVLVRGRFVDVEGKALEGVAVRALGTPDDPIDLLPATTDEMLRDPGVASDAQGRFEVRLGRNQRLRVVRAGYVALWMQPRMTLLPGAPPLDLGQVVLSRGAVFVGVVRDGAGEPVAGAEVVGAAHARSNWWLGAAMWSARTSTRTDERGRFRLRCAPRNALQLQVLADGFRQWTKPAVAEGTPLDVVLEPAGRVRGVALGRDGEPVPGLSVSGRFEAAELIFDAVDRTDAEGRFELTLRVPGRYRLWGMNPGSAMRWISPLLEGPAEGVVLRLGAAGAEGKSEAQTFPVRLVDAGSGAPVVGARVAVVSSQEGAVPGYQTFAHPGSQGPWSDRPLPTTDGAGIAQVGLPPNPARRHNVKIAVRAEGYAAFFEHFDLEAEEGVLELKLLPEAVATGRVVDADGEPVAGADVFWVRRSSRSGGLSFGGKQIHAVSTDETGRYRLAGLPRSELEIVVHHPDFLVPPTAVVDAAEEDALAADFELDPGREIVVRLPAGTSPDGWVATTHANARSRATRRNHQVRFLAGQSTYGAFDDAGVVRFRGRPPGVTQLSLERLSDDGTQSVLQFRLKDLEGEGDEVRVVEASVLETGHLQGQITTDGIPFERLAVLVTGRDRSQRNRYGRGFSVPVEVSGRFSLELRPGDYGLRVEDLATGIALAELDEDFTVLSGGTAEVRMEVRCARVVVRLRPEKGSPAGAMAYGPLLIRSVAADTRLGPLVQGQMPTWRGDRSVEVLLPPGAYILSLRDGAKRLTAGGSWRAATVEELEFRVDGVQDQEIEFVLPPPTPSAEIDR